jgi:hypothetical protein
MEQGYTDGRVDHRKEMGGLGYSPLRPVADPGLLCAEVARWIFTAYFLEI